MYHVNDPNNPKAKDVAGVQLDNGNFIFSWIDDTEGKRIMVLTDSNAVRIAPASGYVAKDFMDWKNTSTWEDNSQSFIVKDTKMYTSGMLVLDYIE